MPGPKLRFPRRRPRPAEVMVVATAVLALGGTVAIREATEPATSQLSLPLEDRGKVVLRLPDEPPSTSLQPPPPTVAPVTPDAGGEPPATPASSSTTSPESSLPSYTWRRLVADDSLAAAGAASGLAAVVAVEGDGFVAVGNAGGLPVVLVSGDAGGWSRVPEGEASLGRAVLRDLVVADGVLLAVGSDGGRPAAWSSFDARAWTPIAVSAGSDGSPRGLVDGVAASPDGRVVAAGFEPGGVGVWTLADSGFEPVTPPSDATGRQTFADVARTASGFFVGGNDDAGRPVIWSSPDGEVWRRSEVAHEGGTASIAAVTDMGEVAVAVGYDDTGPKAWSASDVGGAWSVASGPAPTPARPQSLLAVASTPDGAIAAGQGDGGPLCWSTTDGLRWADCSPSGDLDFAMVRSLTSTGNRHVAVGSAAQAAQEAGLSIWIVE